MYDMRADRHFTPLARVHARALINRDKSLDAEQRKQLLHLLSSRKQRGRVNDAIADVAVQRPCEERDQGSRIGAGLWEWFKKNWPSILQALLALLVLLDQDD